MPNSYDIRAELPNGEHRDFKISAENLSDARAKAEDYIADSIIGSWGPNNRVDWRGQIVFVNCLPAEETVDG